MAACGHRVQAPLPDGQHVRLRSRQLDAYLHASTDGVGAGLHRTPASMNSLWVVHRPPGEHVLVLLQSAAYGRYLAATDSPAPRGQHGFRIVQVKYYYYQADHAILWEIVTHDNYVQLRNAGGGGQGTRHLRANGRYFRFNAGRTRYLPRDTGVTVEGRGTTAHWNWVVETIPPCQAYPGIPGPINEPVPGNLAAIFLGRQRPPWRFIRFVQAAEDGSYVQQANGWNAFDFTGNSIFRLRKEVAEILQTVDTNIVMCVRAGRFGRLAPMLVDMPHDGDGDTVYIVVFTIGTPGEAALRYPDIHG